MKKVTYFKLFIIALVISFLLNMIYIGFFAYRINEGSLECSNLHMSYYPCSIFDAIFMLPFVVLILNFLSFGLPLVIPTIIIFLILLYRTKKKAKIAP